MFSKNIRSPLRRHNAIVYHKEKQQIETYKDFRHKDYQIHNYVKSLKKHNKILTSMNKFTEREIINRFLELTDRLNR